MSDKAITCLLHALGLAATATHRETLRRLAKIAESAIPLATIAIVANHLQV